MLTMSPYQGLRLELHALHLELMLIGSRLAIGAMKVFKSSGACLPGGAGLGIESRLVQVEQNEI